MAKSYRWAYKAQPGYNPPNNDCPECEEPSRTWFIGGRTVDGKAQYTYTCDNHHRWTTDTMTHGNT